MRNYQAIIISLFSISHWFDIFSTRRTLKIQILPSNLIKIKTFPTTSWLFALNIIACTDVRNFPINIRSYYVNLTTDWKLLTSTVFTFHQEALLKNASGTLFEARANPFKKIFVIFKVSTIRVKRTKNTPYNWILSFFTSSK